jgi:hypothetical protein
VLELLEAVYKQTKGAHGRWVGVDSLDLGADEDKTDAAILLAALSGWLQAGGNPPHSVIITAEGIDLLRKRGRL